MGGLDGKVVEIMKSYVNWEKLVESQSLCLWMGRADAKFLFRLRLGTMLCILQHTIPQAVMKYGHPTPILCTIEVNNFPKRS